jgi:hypothetical protein
MAEVQAIEMISMNPVAMAKGIEIMGMTDPKAAATEVTENIKKTDMVDTVATMVVVTRKLVGPGATKAKGRARVRLVLLDPMLGMKEPILLVLLVQPLVSIDQLALQQMSLTNRSTCRHTCAMPVVLVTSRTLE